MGTKELYDFVDDNPSVLALDVASTNDPAQIRQNPRMCAINTALEIDLTGQICADSIGKMQYSGVGGQMDFMRGAALSEHGKPIIVVPSQTPKGISRIVNTVDKLFDFFFYLDKNQYLMILAERRCYCNDNSRSCSLRSHRIRSSKFIW